MREHKQENLFEDKDPIMEEWEGMPEYVHEDMRPESTLIVHFNTWEDRVAFGELLNQTILSTAKFIWYPELDVQGYMNLRYSTRGDNNDT